MLSCRLNETDKVPVYRQILEQVRDLIDNGSLGPGVRLLSTRRLAGRRLQEGLRRRYCGPSGPSGRLRKEMNRIDG